MSKPTNPMPARKPDGYGMPSRLGTIRAGQTVRSVLGGMLGTVLRVVDTGSTPYATVKWSSGSTGRHTVTTLVVVKEAPNARA